MCSFSPCDRFCLLAVLSRQLGADNKTFFYHHCQRTITIVDTAVAARLHHLKILRQNPDRAITLKKSLSGMILKIPSLFLC